MKRHMGAVGMVVVVLFACSLAVAQTEAPEGEKKISVSPSDLPATIKAAVQKALPNGEIVTIEQEVEGEDPGQYDFDVRSGEKTYEVEVSAEGEVIEVKEKGKREGASGEKRWTRYFGQENCTFVTTGKSPFFILEPGYRLVLESKTERVAITVLNETRKIGSVKTRVVEEREEKNGELEEISRNFFAVCKEHGDVFYFGEEVDMYEDGKLATHSGAWRADEPESREGIIMPGTIFLGARHYQEISPKAMDRAEIISNNAELVTPAGKFRRCLKVEETSGLDADEHCIKIYAPGVGLIQDEDLVLVKYGYVGK